MPEAFGIFYIPDLQHPTRGEILINARHETAEARRNETKVSCPAFNIDTTYTAKAPPIFPQKSSCPLGLAYKILPGSSASWLRVQDC